MGMSIRAYAKHRGVSHTAVQKAVRAGRITPEADGSIEPTTADADWNANTRPGQSGVAVGTNSESDARHEDYAVSRAIREEYEAKLKKLEYEKASGQLVERDTVTAHVFTLARGTRDRLLQIPRRVAARVAAESDPRTVEDILDESIREALVDLESFREHPLSSP